jgi:hypothetical protein
MELYVVLDTKGDGRVLGVFDDRATAESFVSQDPCYYRLYPCHLNEVNPESLSWAESGSQRSAMECLIARVAKHFAR